MVFLQPTNDKGHAVSKVTVDDLTEQVKLMRFMRERYDKFKEISNNAWASFKEQETKVLVMLQESDMQKFHVPELGTAFIKRKWKVKVPQTIEDKIKMFDYLSEQYGQDTARAMQTIHSQTLNSFYTQEVEIAMGEGREFSLPGVEDPILEESVNFRKG